MDRKIYDDIKKTLRRFVEINDKYYSVVAVWIMGTYIHDCFYSFPYIYFNATRGGGKTRILGMMSFMAKNGLRTTDLTEANLFRNASTRSFFFDEAENVSKKEFATLRTLLNSAYKKGLVIMRQKKNKQTEEMVTETFDVYTPIALANIWGLDDILQDRCITIILDKSYNPNIVKKIENFDIDPLTSGIKSALNNMNSNHLSVDSDVSDVPLRTETHIQDYYLNFTLLWNALLDNKQETSLNNITTQTTQTTLNDIIGCINYEELNIEPNESMIKLACKLYNSSISGRDLELFLPLFLIAQTIGDDVLDEIVATAEEMVKEKKAEDVVENRDNALISFIAGFDKTGDFIPVSDITKQFRMFEDDEGINPKTIGNALKRLKLVLKKKKMSKGRMVQLDFDKIAEKARQIGVNIEDAKIEHQKLVQELEEIKQKKDEYQSSLKYRPDRRDHEEGA